MSTTHHMQNGTVSLSEDAAELHQEEEELHKWGVGILVVLLILSCSLGHKIAHSSKYFGEGSVACLFGVAAGLFLQLLKGLAPQDWVEDLLIFNPGDFFTYLLPPIIFFAGLSVKKKQFFRNLATISGFGILGTYMCFTIIALALYGISRISNYLSLADCLALGAIFAATDSVAVLQVLDQEKKPLLFSLVFGEGVINDATSIVLLTAVQALGPMPRLTILTVLFILARFAFLFVASTALGLATGLGTSMLLRKLQCESTPQEVAMIGLLSYLAYVLGEMWHLSGILSLFVCGIVISHYGLHNVSPLGRVTTVNAFYTLSTISETLIFVYVGMDAVDPFHWKVTDVRHVWWITLALLLLLLISRAAFVVPVAIAHNKYSQSRLGNSDIAIIWWSGLMRGAVSVALVYHYFDPTGKSEDPHDATLVSATSLLVLFTLCGFGAATKPMMDWLSGGTGYEALFHDLSGRANIAPSVRELADSDDEQPGDEEAALLPPADSEQMPRSASRSQLAPESSTLTPADSLLSGKALDRQLSGGSAVSISVDASMVNVKRMLEEIYTPESRQQPGAGSSSSSRKESHHSTAPALQVARNKHIELQQLALQGPGSGPSSPSGPFSKLPRRPPLHPAAPQALEGTRTPKGPVQGAPQFIRPRLGTNDIAAIIRFRRETSVETAGEPGAHAAALQRVARWWKGFDEGYLQPLFGGPAMPSSYEDTIELNHVGRQLAKKPHGHESAATAAARQRATLGGNLAIMTAVSSAMAGPQRGQVGSTAPHSGGGGLPPRVPSRPGSARAQQLHPFAAAAVPATSRLANAVGPQQQGTLQPPQPGASKHSSPPASPRRGNMAGEGDWGPLQAAAAAARPAPPAGSPFGASSRRSSHKVSFVEHAPLKDDSHHDGQ